MEVFLEGEEAVQSILGRGWSLGIELYDFRDGWNNSRRPVYRTNGAPFYPGAMEASLGCNIL